MRSSALSIVRLLARRTADLDGCTKKNDGPKPSCKQRIEAAGDPDVRRGLPADGTLDQHDRTNPNMPEVSHCRWSIVDAAHQAVLRHPVEQCEGKIVCAKQLHEHRQRPLLRCSKECKDRVRKERRTQPNNC